MTPRSFSKRGSLSHILFAASRDSSAVSKLESMMCSIPTKVKGRCELRPRCQITLVMKNGSIYPVKSLAQVEYATTA